jgi:hypothetical protein
VAGTLEEYEAFKEFVVESEKEEVSLPGADVQLERRQQGGGGGKAEPIISPLLKELTEKKMAQFERERAQRVRQGPVKVAQRPKKGGGEGVQVSKGGGGRRRGGKKGPKRQGGGQRGNKKKPAGE